MGAQLQTHNPSGQRWPQLLLGHPVVNAVLSLLYKRPKKDKKQLIFQYFFDLVSKYLAPGGAKYCEKGLAVANLGEG